MSESNGKTIQISTGTILKIAAIVIALILLYNVREIILVLLIAVTFASALEPLVATARRKLKLPRVLTVILVYIFALGLVGLFFYALTPSFVEQFKELAVRYQEFTKSIEQEQGTLPEFFRRTGLSTSLGNLFQGFTGVSGSAFGTAIGVVTGFLEIISILVISFYLVIEQGAARNTIKQLIPEKHQEKAVRVMSAIQRKLGFWLLGQLILSLSIFLVTYVILSLFNIKLALALAALAGILEIVPYLGPFIASIPAILVAFTQSPALALVVAILYLLIQKTEGYILVPKIMQKTVGIHPLLVLISILIGFKLAGVLGALLAVPVVAAGSVIFEAYVFGRTPTLPPSAEEAILNEK